MFPFLRGFVADAASVIRTRRRMRERIQHRRPRVRCTTARFRHPARRRRGLNSGIFVIEAIAGYQAGSLALLMDSVHNPVR